MPQPPPLERLRRPFVPAPEVEEDVSRRPSRVTSVFPGPRSTEAPAGRGGRLLANASCACASAQVDVVGEGDDFLSDDSDLNEPEDRKPRRTRWTSYCCDAR